MYEAGKQLGRYQIRAPLGAGGMGEVYLAEDSRLRRKIALKVLPENIAQDKDRLRRFEQEALAASALNHPNILTIYEFGAENDTHFLAAEFVEGETLRKRIGAVKPLNRREVLDIAAQIAAALDAAHAAGIIHRDIKPENIMLREDGLVKVLDFGLVKLIEKKAEDLDLEAQTIAQANTNAGMILGTPTYMSPEQARGKPVDKRTDLWSCGVVLYELLAGKPPFTGETISDIIASVLTKEPDSFDDSKIYVPAELKKIVFTLLQKEPEKRYQSAKDLQLDLRKLEKTIEQEPATQILPVSNESENKTTNLQASKTNPQNDETGESSINRNAARRKFIYFGLGFCLLAVTAFFVWFNSPKNLPNDFSATSIINTKNEAKLYSEMNEAEQLAFIKEKMPQIQNSIGDTPTDLTDGEQQLVKFWVDRFMKRADSLSQKPFEEGLRTIYGRASQISPIIARAYTAQRLSPNLGIYQAMIESEYRNCWVSELGIGLFQFSPDTAKEYGFSAADSCDVEKQSNAAALYMSNLTSDFDGNKSLALLGFNIGERRLRDYLRQLNQKGISERNYWTIHREAANLQPKFLKEEDYYLPRFFAAAIIGESPEVFDLPLRPLSTLKEMKR